MADESPLNIRYEEAKGTRISGSTDPNSVPFTIKYHMFVSNYETLFGPAIAQDLIQSDDAILANASSTLNTFRESNQATIDSEMADLCSQRSSMAAEAVATQVDRIYADSEARLENHLRNIVSQLSDSGRSKVVDYVDNIIAPRIHIVIPPTSLEFLHENRAEFEFWIENECHRALTGEYPAELKARMDQARRQILRNNTDSMNEDE